MSAVIDVGPSRLFNLVCHRQFRGTIAALREQSDLHRQNLDLRPHYKGHECWLGPNAGFGFAVTPDRELINVFSQVNGGGRLIMDHAVTRYPDLHLNCYAGALEQFYQGYGFDVYRREPNWQAGGPDVVFMRRGLVPGLNT